MKATNRNITLGRSMEFGVDLKYDLIVVPRNTPFASPSPVRSDPKDNLKSFLITL